MSFKSELLKEILIELLWLECLVSKISDEEIKEADDVR